MLSMAIPEAEVSAVRFFAVCCSWSVFKKWIWSGLLERNTTVQLSTPYTLTLSATIHIVTDRQTDGRTDRHQYCDSGQSLLRSRSLRCTIS